MANAKKTKGVSEIGLFYILEANLFVRFCYFAASKPKMKELLLAIYMHFTTASQLCI